MTKVHHVKSARKADPAHGIEVGDAYYHWKVNRFTPLQKSKTYPRPSQLATGFAQQVAEIGEHLADLGVGDDLAHAAENLRSDLEDVAQEARDLAAEQQEKLDNMPEGLRQGDTGQLLEERASALEGWADDLERIEVPARDDGESDENYRARLEEALEEAQATEPAL